MDIGHQKWDRWIIAGLGLLFFLPFLGAAPLFDWDEINFAESAREMIVSGNYFQVQIDFEPFWEKPPVFIWMQAAAMKCFGINEFAARLPNALVGVATLLTLYGIGSKLRGRRFGWLLTAFFGLSLLPFLYFKSGIIDPTFNFLIFLGLMQIVFYELGEKGEKPRWAPHWAGFWIGMATLTKGPVALLVLSLVYFTWKLIWDRRNIPWLALVKFTGVYLLVIASWFGSLILFSKDGWVTVEKFIIYQAELFSQAVAGHEQPFFYHFLVFLIGCFPMSAFAVRGMILRDLTDKDRLLRNMMLVWFWVVLILFTVARTKIVHYSSMLYFPGAFLAALTLEKYLDEGRRPKWDTWLILGMGFLVIGTLTLGVNAIAAQQPWLQTQATNPFMAAALGADVKWSGWEFLPGLVFVLAAATAFVFLWRKQFKGFFLALLVGMPILINGLNALVLPRIADYSQNTAINFFKEKSKEDAYILVLAYKSYAQYFYGEVKPFPHPEVPVEERGSWLAGGPIDKPVYMVTRIEQATDEFDRWFGFFKRFDEKNGFVFYKREAVAPK